MRARSTLHVALLCGLAALSMLVALVFTGVVGRAEAGGKKMNLQVLPATTSEKEVRSIMKGWSTSLGVKCDFCHEVSDFSKDTEHKQFARVMARMVNDLNTNHLVKYKVKVTCNTCHRGHEEPPKQPWNPGGGDQGKNEQGEHHDHDHGQAPAPEKK